MSKKSCLREPLDKEHGKRAQTLLESEQEHLYHFYWSLWRQLSWKKSLLVICKVLRLFVNTLTVDDKCSLLSWENLMKLIKMLLSQKQKLFLSIFLGMFEI